MTLLDDVGRRRCTRLCQEPDHQVAAGVVAGAVPVRELTGTEFQTADFGRGMWICNVIATGPRWWTPTHRVVSQQPTCIGLSLP